MGIVKSSLLAVAFLAAPVVAMAQDDSAAPVLQDFRLDPSRDPNRPRAPERAGPEIRDVPDAVPLPSVNAPVASAPPPAAATPPPVVAPTVVRPRTAPVRPVVAENARPAPAPSDSPAPVEVAPERAPPASVATNEAAPAPPPSVAEAEPTSASPLPWIIGGIAAVLLAAFLLFRRRSRIVTEPDEPFVEDALAPAVVPEPAPAIADPVVPAPTPSPAVVTRVQAETPAAAPLTLRFVPVQVRTTFTGAQLEYRLTVRNESAVPIDGIAVAAFMANADAQQVQVLGAFFDDPFAPEQHRVPHIEPGAEIVVSGALSLDQVSPIEVQGRALLIPLVAFKVISLDGDDLARATFIVGQESTPPRAKMGPFRLDQGPRQYREIGSRAA